ncbi:MAG: hypothetical protein DUD27_02400 [Lachnospiraceae bacterium]|uniref:Uncharacterized protein n=1 Tax=Candidatus Weimeria bifida TaxID=2599074 RepID=A0A6N7J076_9FIRM|nr:hypothetical protein [Candidatus Weimeria bifida]RRF97104.1 MAG: hypothetical protein DUD27_02400 [Lachnospiraceae bacterium]
MNISAVSNTSHIRAQEFNAIRRQKPVDDDIAAVTNAYSDNSKVTARQNTESNAAQSKKQEESFGAYDYAKLYDPNKTFDLSGQDLSDLDAVGTLGQLRKDELMGQYQNLTKQTTASVRPEENFSL